MSKFGGWKLFLTRHSLTLWEILRGSIHLHPRPQQKTPFNTFLIIGRLGRHRHRSVSLTSTPDLYHFLNCSALQGKSTKYLLLHLHLHVHPTISALLASFVTHIHISGVAATCRRPQHHECLVAACLLYIPLTHSILLLNPQCSSRLYSRCHRRWRSGTRHCQTSSTSPRSSGSLDRKT